MIADLSFPSLFLSPVTLPPNQSGVVICGDDDDDDDREAAFAMTVAIILETIPSHLFRVRKSS